MVNFILSTGEYLEISGLSADSKMLLEMPPHVSSLSPNNPMHLLSNYSSNSTSPNKTSLSFTNTNEATTMQQQENSGSLLRRPNLLPTSHGGQEMEGSSSSSEGDSESERERSCNSCNSGMSPPRRAGSFVTNPGSLSLGTGPIPATLELIIEKISSNPTLRGQRRKCLGLVNPKQGSSLVTDWASVPSDATLIVLTADDNAASFQVAKGIATSGLSSVRNASFSRQRHATTEFHPLENMGHHRRVAATMTSNASVMSAREIWAAVEQQYPKMAKKHQNGAGSDSRNTIISMVPSISSSTVSPPSSPKRENDETKENEELPMLLVGKLVQALARDKGATTISAMQEYIDVHKKKKEEEAKRKLLSEEGGSPGGENLPVEAMKIEDIKREVLALIPSFSVEHLSEFGFDLLAIQRCLLENGLHEENALNQLVSVSDSSVAFAREMGDEEWRKYYRQYIMVKKAHHDPRIQQLVDMGFSVHDAKYYLRGASGNVSEAAAALLGEPNALGRIAQRNSDVSWFEKLDVELEAGIVDAELVLEIVNELLHNPQSVVLLWTNPRTHDTFDKMVKTVA